MSNDITLTAQKREVLGKKVKQLRNDGQTPAVIHERGKDSIYVSVPALDFGKAYHAAGKHHAIKLDVDGKKYTTLIKEVINAPASSSVLHAVFQAIKEDEKVTAEIPLKLTGEIPAERASLLIINNLDHVTVEALPKDLVDVVEVDASSLEEVGNKLHVSDIKLPDSITIKTEPDQVIATVEMPKDQIAEADAALAEQQAAEGEESEAAEGSEEAPAEGEKPAEEAAPEESKE
jgi:large subunit ribosomal protein L25